MIRVTTTLAELVLIFVSFLLANLFNKFYKERFIRSKIFSCCAFNHKYSRLFQLFFIVNLLDGYNSLNQIPLRISFSRNEINADIIYLKTKLRHTLPFNFGTVKNLLKKDLMYRFRTDFS